MAELPVLSSELLGFPADARVLIVNCDDFGMRRGVDAAVVEAIESGIAGSCSLMVPCGGTEEAMAVVAGAARGVVRGASLAGV